MGNMTIATIFIVLVNVLMWFSQIAMLNMNPNGSVCYTLDGSIIKSQISDQQGIYSNGTLNNNVVNDLPPSTASAVAPSQSTGFVTDLFNNILGWIKSIPGLNYIINIVGAPYNILKCMGMPNEFVLGIGTLWYMVSFLILISFLWWRD